MNEQKAREIKKLRSTLEETNAQQKTFEQKYMELKKYTQSNTEEFIEYKEKAQKYDSVSNKNKELDATVKSLQGKLSTANEEIAKMTATMSKNVGRWNEREKEWEKLKKMEREFDYQRNQNINLHQSIEAYEHRYNELKKYCIRIESAYNKFVSAKKKSGTESRLMDDDKEEKQIQSKFIELNKKVNDCEINYYKQQIDELQEQKNFLSIYYEKKLREDKDKIFDSK